jgi:hypothetical protein
MRTPHSSFCVARALASGLFVGLLLLKHPVCCSQEPPSKFAQRAVEVEQGSRIARAGFQNEDRICEAFQNCRTDSEAQAWLAAMSHPVEMITSVSARRLHGKKADVEVRLEDQNGLWSERISVKLVSNPRGFNQVDKRWLATYSELWNMPRDVQESLKLYTGETRPRSPGRSTERMFLTELTLEEQQAVIRYFTEHKHDMISDVLQGNGPGAAEWMLITCESQDVSSHSTLPPIAEIIQHFSSGDVAITAAGNLRIGRVSMQRKGGDNGRRTANMLQFKINPMELFELDKSAVVPESGRNASKTVASPQSALQNSSVGKR